MRRPEEADRSGPTAEPASCRAPPQAASERLRRRLAAPLPALLRQPQVPVALPELLEVGAAEAPAPGESVRDTSPLSGSPSTSLAGLSPAAFGSLGSSVIEVSVRIQPDDAGRLRPVERAFLPGIRIAGHQNRQEDDHFNQAEQRQLVNDDRPRKHEHGLHVENHEQHGNKVIPDAVPVARVGRRFDAALIRLELDLVVFLRLHHLRHHQGEDGEPDGDEQEDEDRDVRVEHRVEPRPLDDE